MVARLTSISRSLELGDHVLDAGYRFDLIGVGRMEELNQRALALPAKDREIVHLVARCGDARMVAAADLEGRAVDHLERHPQRILLRLHQLQTEAMIRP